jgi:hypothetical protein
VNRHALGCLPQAGANLSILPINILWKESGDTTIQMVRLLYQLNIPDSVIAKIVTTSPNEMSYLLVDDLWEMGVKVTGHPEPGSGDVGSAIGAIGRALGKLDRQRMNGLVFLSPAVVRQDVALNNGSTIPAGTVVVARDDVTLEAFVAADKAQTLQSLSLCFVTTHLCTVSYHLANGPVAVTQLQDASLDLIRQGWQDWTGGRPEWSHSREVDKLPPPADAKRPPSSNR